MTSHLQRHLFFPLIAAAALVASGCTAESQPQQTPLAVGLVNVPAGKGSLGPHLATGPGDGVVLSWTEPDGNRHRLLYTTLVDDAWSEPAPVATGDNWFVNWADFPSVVPLSDSLWAAHWLERQPASGYAYDVQLSVSKDGGSTWSEPLKPHDDNTPTEHGFVTLFPSGSDLGVIWLDGRNMVNPPWTEGTAEGIADGMTLRAATVPADLSITNEGPVDELTCDCCQTDVAVTEDAVVAVYRNRTEDETRDIYAARLTGEEWQPGHPVADDGWTIAGCPVNGPVVDADGNRVAVAWFTAAGEQPRIRIARSTDAAASFAPPVDVVAGDTSGHPGLALLPDNQLAVSWICDLPEEHAGVCLRTVSNSDRLGPVHVLSGDARVAVFSVPQLALGGDSLIAAWTEEVEDSTVIASARIPVASLR